MAYAASAFLGGLFAVAALSKLRNPAAFRAALSGYRLVPPRLIGPAAAAVIFLELATAAVCIGWPGQALGIVAAAVLLILFALAGTLTLLRGIRTNCGCATGSSDRQLTATLPARNLILAFAGLASLTAPVPAQPIAAWLAGLLLLALLFLVEAAMPVVWKGRSQLMTYQAKVLVDERSLG